MYITFIFNVIKCKYECNKKQVCKSYFISDASETDITLKNIC